MINSALLARLVARMDEADMAVVAYVMGVSLATAYRYRKSPSDMSIASFVRLADHFNLPVSMNLIYRETDVLVAEAERLRLEEEIHSQRGWRFVTTPHFTVNCETEAFTRELFAIQYGARCSEPEANEYVSLRKRRRSLYLLGQYKSEEIVSAPSYIDFFYGRGLFKDISKSVRQQQLEEVITTSKMPHISRRVYTQTTPELPVILNYSTRKSLVRVEDLTIALTDTDCDELIRTLRSYADRTLDSNAELEPSAFFSNPLIWNRLPS